MNTSESKSAGGQDIDSIDDPGPPSFFMRGVIILNRVRGSATVFVGACLLGTIPLFSHPLHNAGIPTAVISGIRMALSCLLAALLCLTSRTNPLRVQRSERKALLLLGTLGSGLTSLLYTASLKYTTIAIAILAVFVTVPITTYVMNKMHRQLRLRHIACFGMVVAGFVLLCWDKIICQEGRSLPEHCTGICFGIATGLCFGTYAPFGKRLIALPAAHILVWAFGIGFLCHVPMLLLLENSCSVWSGYTPLHLLGLGFFGCFLPYLLIQQGMKSKHVTSMQVSMFFLLEPIISILIGLRFGETLSVWNAFGIVLVFASILIYQFPSHRTRSSKHE